MTVLNLRNIEDTTLWKQLATGFQNTEWKPLATQLAPSLIDLCREAGDRMKAVPINMPQYTLHDQVHLLRVTELMSMVLGSVLTELNPIEIAMLILSAHFHDHGMVLSSEDILALEANKDFILHRDNWAIEHPNLAEFQQQLARRDLSDQERARYRRQGEDLQRAMVTDYIRGTHARRSRDFVRQEYSTDARWTVLGTSLADMVGKLCESHGQGLAWMNQANGFYDDRSVGTLQVNMRYLGIILRLADILDLDRDRTPDLLYRAIHFSNKISITEWEKHRAVEGWTISPTQIRFTMEFTHPAYERTARRFMDWVDEELADSKAVVRSFPAPIAARYRLDLPDRVTRDRLGPKDNCYRYHELEFSLSRDEIVKLLMTNNLYGDPSLAIRELVQNSLDALRYRRALHAREGSICPPGGVRLEHGVDANGHEVVRCSDNGVGMDEGIITRFLTRVGRSFYRSPQFEQERISFRAAGIDFDPCARFGIGFMSCFMLGDHIVVRTRRDDGPKKGHGEPLVVEINGLGGILVIRQGQSDQPIGTTVEITGRSKPRFFDEWTDKVKLIRIIDAYALATEFSIEAQCSIPEIKRMLKVPAQIAVRTSPLERAGLKSVVTLRQDFSEIDRRLQGEIRASFLTDTASLPTLSNSEATWVREAAPDSRGPVIRLASGAVLPDRSKFDNYGSICIDGMLVSGVQGRTLTDHDLRLGSRHETIPLGLPHVIDIRGDIKPALTPARTPVERSGSSLPASWQRIQKLMWLGQGRLWEKFASFLSRGMSNETFWEMTQIHSVPLFMMRFSAIWSYLSVPVADDSGVRNWAKLSTIGRLKYSESGSSKGLIDMTGRRVVHHVGMDKWVRDHHGDDPYASTRSIVVFASTLVLDGDRPEFELMSPRDPDRSPCEYLTSGVFGWDHYPIAFGMGLKGFFSACLPLRCINREHPLVLRAIESMLSERPSDIEEFGQGCVNILGEPSIANALTTTSQKPIPRWLKWLGCQYRSIDWTRLSKDLHPPYKIWCDPRGVLEVEARHFETWADSQMVEDDD